MGIPPSTNGIIPRTFIILGGILMKREESIRKIVDVLWDYFQKLDLKFLNGRVDCIDLATHLYSQGLRFVKKKTPHAISALRKWK